MAAMRAGFSVVLSIALLISPSDAVGSHDDESGVLQGTGTGFFISTNGYFLSNYHVISGASGVAILQRGKIYNAVVVQVDRHNDLALLKAEGVFHALALGDSDATRLGAKVFTIGFPNPKVQGTQPKFTEGAVSATTGIADDPRLFQISVPIQPGNSGGPLVDESGNVIGLTTSMLNALNIMAHDDYVPQNVNYAIKVAYARTLISAVKYVADEALPTAQSQLLWSMLCSPPSGPLRLLRFLGSRRPTTLSLKTPSRWMAAHA